MGDRLDAAAGVVDPADLVAAENRQRIVATWADVDVTLGRKRRCGHEEHRLFPHPPGERVVDAVVNLTGRVRRAVVDPVEFAHQDRFDRDVEWTGAPYSARKQSGYAQWRGSCWKLSLVTARIEHMFERLAESSQ